MQTSIKLIVVLILILLNAFFVASEYALVTVRKTKIQELVRRGKKQSKILQEAKNNLTEYISATQLGVTVTSLAVGWLGEGAIALVLQPLANALPHFLSIISVHTIAITCAFLIVTYFHVIIGEITPKSIALKKPESVALNIILPLYIFVRIFKPFIWILNSSATFLLKITKLNISKHNQGIHSEEEIKMILTESVEGGLIEKQEVQMVNNVFQLADMPINKIMVPAINIVSFDINSSIEEISKRVKEHTFSRFPVYEKKSKDVTGFIHVKDIFRVMLDKQIDNNTTIKNLSIVRDIIFLNETMKVDDALGLMKKKHIHIAMVNNKSGKNIGLITLEDIVESVVGEIEDEFDR